MGKDYYAEEVEKSEVKDYYSEEVEKKEPEVGFFGKVPLSEYQAGKRNIMGNIMDRPAGAIRSTIAGKGYTAGAVNPNAVAPYQEQALEAFYEKVKNNAGNIKNPLLRNTYVASQIPAGMGVSTIGLAADTITNPAQLLTMIAGRTPLPKAYRTFTTNTAGNLIPRTSTVGEAIAVSKPAQAMSKFANAPLEETALGRTLTSTRGGAFGGAKNVDAVIDQTINKAIRPTVVGKSTATQTAKYYENAREGVKTIAENMDNIQYEDPTHPMGFRTGAPQSLGDFSKAIEQTKFKIFDDYNNLATRAGQEGVGIELNPIGKALREAADNTAMADLSPEIRRYIINLADRLEKRGSYTPQEAQAAIKILNKKLESYYRNPTYNDSQKSVIDALVANNLRKSLDDAILNASERLPSDKSMKYTYADLKRKYGSLKAIEKDVNHRVIVDARRNNKGLIDFSDIFSAGHLVKGLLTSSKGDVVLSVGQKALSAYYKYLNNPNRMIKGMFEILKRRK